MVADRRVVEFVERAMAAGMPHEAVVGVLTSSGWSEKEIYGALAEYYRGLTGMEIPRRVGAGASAKEAFLYLLLFGTLATWTMGIGFLAFALIDRWLADPLFSGDLQVFDTYIITSSLAALMVAFPLYLLISRAVVGEVAAQPEQLDSPVRKWLTYMALVPAAGIFMGDLIAALAYLLRGELTSRFVAKSFVVLALSGCIFSYYFGGLRKTDAPAAGKVGRDRLLAGLCSIVVGLLVVLAFVQLGSPSVQRNARADMQRAVQLYQINLGVNGYWTTHAAKLPGASSSWLGANFRGSSLPILSRDCPMSITPGREASTSCVRCLREAAMNERWRSSRTRGSILPGVTASRWTPRWRPRSLCRISGIRACWIWVLTRANPWLDAHSSWM